MKINTLIIGDVHGRDFWKEPVKETLEKYPEAKIIFLGDFLDCYPFEWEKHFDYEAHAFENFKEIIELKKANPDRITLLLGNHDCTYAISTDICDCRRDRARYKEIEQIFEENRSLFRLIEDVKINGKTFIFSHAGISKKFIESAIGNSDAMTIEDIKNIYNEAWIEDKYEILNTLGEVDFYRGGWSSFASFVWSDIRTWGDLKEDDTYGYNVVGHTYCDSPIALDTIVDLDCRQAFYLDSEGKLRHYNNDEEVKKYKTNRA